MISKENIGSTDGLGGEETFYTKNFPITDSAGATTDDETEVNVYKRVAGAVSWTELNDNGTEFTIDGSEGQVVIAAAVNDAEYEISIDYYTKRQVAVGQNVEFRTDQPLSSIHQLGTVSPQETKEGLITINGSIGTLYTNRDVIGKELSLTDFYSLLSDYTLTIYPNAPGGTPESSSKYIKVTDTKYSGGKVSVDLGGIVAVDVVYSGLVASVETVP